MSGNVRPSVCPSHLTFLRTPPTFLFAADRRRRRRCMSGNVRPSVLLDVSIEVLDRRFFTKTYDKRDDYSFEIINYPDLGGNIPQGAAYGVYISQVLRYARVCSEKTDFDQRVRTLTGKLIKKGYTKERLKKTLHRCYQKYSWIPAKYKS